MAPPRKTGAASPDPEAANDTLAKAPNPLAGDPEAAQSTQARAPRPKGARPDPEAAHATQAKARSPLAGEAEASPSADPELVNQTQARGPPPGARGAGKPRPKPGAGPPPADQEDSDYRTGQSYQPSAAEEAQEEAPAGALSLEGDGLDPVDPELAPRTKALPQLEQGAEPGDDDDDAEDDHTTRAGPPLKLEIVAGPDAGKKKKIKGVRLVIGRTPGVDLQLSDQSVSRRHVELIRTDDGVVLKDLKSGNGTKVNGQKVSEKLLEHGDEIAIGKTKLRFVDEVGAFMKAKQGGEQQPAEAAVPEGAPAGAAAADAEEGAAEGEEAAPADEAAGDPKRVATSVVRRASKAVRTSRQSRPQALLAKFKALRPPVRLAITVGAAVFLLLLIVFAATRKSAPPPVDPLKVAAEEKMQLARNAMRDGHFEEAVKLIETAEELQPGIDKTHQGNKAREEFAIQRGLADARTAIGEKRFEAARALLAKVGASVKGDAERRKVELELAAAELEAKQQKIDELLASGDVEGARAVLAELPVEQQAEPGVKIATFEKELEALQAGEKLDEQHRAALAAAAQRQRDAEALATALAVVERKFAGAEWDRAASECSRVIDGHRGEAAIVSKAKQLMGQIPNFGRNYEEGMKKFRQGQLANAARPLRQAWTLYGQMGLKGNPYQQELAEKLAQASLAQGREALLRNDLETAALAFKDASKLDPNEPKGRAGLDEVITRAEDLYHEAYMIRDREPQDARRKLKTVIAVTPAGSATHEKAKNHLASMPP